MRCVVLSGCNTDLPKRNAIISFRLRRTKSPHGWSLFDHTSLSFHAGARLYVRLPHFAMRRAQTSLASNTPLYSCFRWAWALGNCRMRTGRPSEVCACVRISHIQTISIFSPFHSIWFMSSTRNMYSTLGGLEVLLQQRSYVGRALKWDGIKCGGGQFRPKRFSVIKSCWVCLYLKHARIQK